MVQPKDLSLVSVDELFEELNRRFDIWIFSGMQFRDQKESKIFTMRKWRGNSATCAGLASQLQIACYDAHVEQDEVDDEPFEV